MIFDIVFSILSFCQESFRGKEIGGGGSKQASKQGSKEVSGKVLVVVQMADGGDTDKNIEIWKIKKLIKALESARGNGTSMISLIMPPRSQSFFTLFFSF